MPRKKKELGFAEGVEDFGVTINSTLPSDVKIVFNPAIAELDLDLGREDLNKMVAKINELVRKVN